MGFKSESAVESESVRSEGGTVNLRSNNGGDTAKAAKFAGRICGEDFRARRIAC
jgi:hypothetical protein